MRPVDFKEANVRYGESQDEYKTLPSLKSEEGDVVSCWALSWREIIRLIVTRKVWLCVKTFNSPLQPLFMTTKKSDVIQ